MEPFTLVLVVLSVLAGVWAQVLTVLKRLDELEKNVRELFVNVVRRDPVSGSWYRLVEGPVPEREEEYPPLSSYTGTVGEMDVGD